MLDTLAGIIENVTFHNSENGFSVLKLSVKGEKQMVTLVGNAAHPSAGECLRATGEWIQDKKFGAQFKASEITTSPPTNAYGIEKYLGSGIIKGIRESTAKRLVQTFGKRVFEILDNEPHQIATVAGISAKQAERIGKSWQGIRAVRDLIGFLSEYGITPADTLRIHKRYDEEAIQKIRENPYCLVFDIRGFSFQTSDRIARQLGFDSASPLRIRAGLVYVLAEAQFEGHCGLPKGILLQQTQKLLSHSDSNQLEELLKVELSSGRMMLEQLKGLDVIFSARFYKYETVIAERIKDLCVGELSWGKVNHENALEWVERKQNIRLSESQQKAFKDVLKSKVAMVTGGPGVGKTTLLKSILSVLKESKIDVILAAPTGRAAKRMSEVTGMEARTLHRVLEISTLDRQFQRTHERQLECDYAIIDEMSMVDVPLFFAFLEALPKRAGLLLVGDPDQLPSVGAGCVLDDIRSSESIPCIHLEEVYRQGSESNVVAIAHSINKGIFPQLTGYGKQSDFFFLEAKTPEEAFATVSDVVTRRLPENLGFDAKADIQVLAPMNKGALGVRSLNENLQKILNATPENIFSRNGNTFGTGDKVMQIRNNYEKEVYNGDIGIIKQIVSAEETVIITFDDRDISYDFGDMDDIVLSYAVTIHKSQGSEYPVVIIPLLTEHRAMLQRNLIYTAITRGKKMVVLIGEREALSMAIHNNKSRKRWTLLEKLLEKPI